MRYIATLSAEEKSTLEEGVRNHTEHHFRNRCKSVLMSDEGFSVPEIANFLKVRTRTVYAWFDRRETVGISGLRILPGRGRRAILNKCGADEISIIEETVREHPQSLGEVCKKLNERLGFSVTKKMLRSFLKKNSVIPGNASEEF